MQHVVVELFIWALGLCIGSFLNVVVYRLAVGLSITNPVRSFCPRCRADIAWYDNIPVLSWVILGGRCRHCRATISVQYPLVEALTGLTFVLVYHLLFVSGARVGLVPAHLPGDIPILLAWLVLAAGLVACSAMDIVSYTVDIRVTNFVLGVGVVLHALWPNDAFIVPRATTAATGAAVAVFLASIVLLWWTLWRHADDEPGDESQHDSDADQALPESKVARFAACLGTAVFVAFAIWLMYLAFRPATGPAAGGLPVAAALVSIFTAIVLIGGQQRPADDEIKAAIDEEQPHARRGALRELLWLSPAIVAGVLIFCAIEWVPGVRDAWRAAVQWSPGGGFAPVAGAAFAIHGAMIGAAAGWVARIVFTLAFGREAFGTGDIYILAAAGAVTGWDIVLLGLLLAVFMALGGVVVGLLLKTTAIIPLGPWLALGFLWALWWNEPARHYAKPYVASIVHLWHTNPLMLFVAAGLILVAAGASIPLSRLLRKTIVPDSE